MFQDSFSEGHIYWGRFAMVIVAATGSQSAAAIQLTAGQPVIIGGSMETGSYLLAGVGSSAPSFYSTAHGSGRTMSRAQAKKKFRGRELQQQMEARGIYVRTASYAGLAEEAGEGFAASMPTKRVTPTGITSIPTIMTIVPVTSAGKTALSRGTMREKSPSKIPPIVVIPKMRERPPALPASRDAERNAGPLIRGQR